MPNAAIYYPLRIRIISTRASKTDILPQELASFVYYVNTQPVEQGQISLVLTADIDLCDYKWAPMGWSGGGNSDHPFSFCVYGENTK